MPWRMLCVVTWLALPCTSVPGLGGCLAPLPRLALPCTSVPGLGGCLALLGAPAARRMPRSVLPI
eukprot:4949130-Alexandrium_andersonii.AAC.1